MQNQNPNPNPNQTTQPAAYVNFIAPVGKALFTLRTKEDSEILNRSNGFPVHSAIITLTERQLFQAGLVATVTGEIKVQINTEETNVLQRFVTYGIRALVDPTVDGIESMISIECLLNPIVFELWMNAKTPGTWEVTPEFIDEAIEKLEKIAKEAIEREKNGENPAQPQKKLIMP